MFFKTSCLTATQSDSSFYMRYHHVASFSNLLQLFTDAQKRLRIIIA